MRLFKTYEVLDVPSHGIKSHMVVKVVLDVKCPKSNAWQTRVIKMLPVPEEALCKEDTSFLKLDELDRYIDSFREAVDSEVLDIIWKIGAI